MESSNYMVYRRIGRPLVKFIRVLGFSPRICGMRFQTTNTSIWSCFWMISMMILEVLWIIEVV